MPKDTSSPGTEPDPIPSSKRPPEKWSRVTAWRASTAGWRIASQSTRCAEAQAFGASCEPGRGGEGLVHRLVGRAGWREVVHERHPDEPRRFGGPRPFEQRVGPEAQLREEQVELDARRSTGTAWRGGPAGPVGHRQTRSTSWQASSSNC